MKVRKNDQSFIVIERSEAKFFFSRINCIVKFNTEEHYQSINEIVCDVFLLIKQNRYSSVDIINRSSDILNYFLAADAGRSASFAGNAARPIFNAVAVCAKSEP